MGMQFERLQLVYCENCTVWRVQLKLAWQGLVLGGEDFLVITVFKGHLKHLQVSPVGYIVIRLSSCTQFVVGYKVGSLLLTAVTLQLIGNRSQLLMSSAVSYS